MLTRPGHENRTYEFSGPQLLSFADMAAVLTAELGREIRYVDLPPQDFRRQMLALGLAHWNVDAMLGLFALIREDRNARVTDQFEAIAGRPAAPAQRVRARSPRSILVGSQRRSSPWKCRRKKG